MSELGLAVLAGIPGCWARPTGTKTRTPVSRPRPVRRTNLIADFLWGVSQGRLTGGDRDALDAAEEHAPGRRLQDAGHGDLHLLADVRPALLDHDHGPVLEVPHPLPGLVARLD